MVWADDVQDEFGIGEDDQVDITQRKPGEALHNCLIDCHEDVWTQFPVLAAVPRQVILSSHGCCPSKLVFVMDGEEHHQHINPYFLDLKQRFYKKTLKPLGNDLKNMEATAQHFYQFMPSLGQGISIFCAREWIVNIICLVCDPAYYIYILFINVNIYRSQYRLQ